VLPTKLKDIVSWTVLMLAPPTWFLIISFIPFCIINAEQLERLLAVIRVGGRGGGHKTAKFTSAKGTEWRILRRNFEQTTQINGWPNERQQRKGKKIE
jgi:hypothetical protein